MRICGMKIKWVYILTQNGLKLIMRYCEEGYHGVSTILSFNEVVHEVLKVLPFESHNNCTSDASLDGKSKGSAVSIIRVSQ